MNTNEIPLLIEPEELPALLDREDLLLVDLSKREHHAAFPLPGAVHLDYAKIVAADPPVAGLLPAISRLETVLGETGIGAGVHVVALDDEGGGNASRLLWTLECLGHTDYSLLNGGLVTWAKEGFPLASGPPGRQTQCFHAQFNPAATADANYILDRLHAEDFRLLDARSPEEHAGTLRYANRGGHIPGALNWDWNSLRDPDRNLRLQPLDLLEAALHRMGVSSEHEVVTYCQTHHRSSLTWFVMKLLGHGNVRGYPGSWSDWGNRTDTPVEPAAAPGRL